MAIATNDSRVYAALQFKNLQDSMYIGLGKTSEWNNEEVPPTENPETSELLEPIGYKKVSKVQVCRELKPDEEPEYPTVKYGSKTFVLIPDEQAYKEKAWNVYITGQIDGEELPIGRFRQVGIYTGLKPKENKKNLLPEEVTDKGVLQAFANRRSQRRDKNVDLYESYIISFENKSIV